MSVRRCAECGEGGRPGRTLVRVERHPETVWKHLDCASAPELRRFETFGRVVRARKLEGQITTRKG